MLSTASRDSHEALPELAKCLLFSLPSCSESFQNRTQRTFFFSLMFIYLFIWLHQVFIEAHWIFITACGLFSLAYVISFPDQGLNLGPLHWALRVLATGPPGKSCSPSSSSELFRPGGCSACFPRPCLDGHEGEGHSGTSVPVTHFILISDCPHG